LAEISSSRQPADARLVGRSTECAAVVAFVERAARDGDVLLVTGDPGVGKTALVEAALRNAEASGAVVLAARGVQFEAGVGFAGLHQLLLPLLPALDELDEPHRRALDVALGRGTGPLPDRLLVSAAVLELLTRVARSRPVVMVVDDAPWLDVASGGVLGFVAHRLRGNRIGLLVAARTGSDHILLHPGVPRLHLEPLDRDAATQLLAARFPFLDVGTRQRVLSASAGNPLALLELPAVMTDAQRGGAAPLPFSLMLSEPLLRAFVPQVVALPRATRWLLLLAALEGTGDLPTLRAAAADDRWLDDLAPAETAHIVHVDLRSRRLTFRHPLIGAATVDTSTSGERQRAHAALADVLADRPEECASHLVEATMGADPRAGDLLETAARRAELDGDPVRAVTTLLQSANATPPGPDRARRLAAAAYLGVVTTGDLRTVPELLQEARTGDPGTATSAEVAVAAIHLLTTGGGDADTVHRMLERAAGEAIARGAGAPVLDGVLYSLLVVCHFAGRDDWWSGFERALEAAGPGLSPLLSTSAEVLADPARATGRGLEQLEELVASTAASVDVAHVVRIGIAATYADRLSPCRPALRRVARTGREGGAAGSALNALMLLCRDAFDEGRWEEATRMADEGAVQGAELDHRLLVQVGVYCRGLVAAARGDDPTARALADELVEWSTPRGWCIFEHFAHRVRGLSDLGRGDYASAYRELTAISPAGRFAPYAPVAVTVALDLVEAAVRTGRRAEAAAHLAAMDEVPMFRDRPRYLLVAAGSAALVTTGTEASERFERALAVPGAQRYPFERARIQLAYGEHLRRTRSTRPARLQLAAAMETFRDLGARPWVIRAENELSAAGLAPRVAPDDTGAGALTAQERQIALLAASGMSNKQIGSRLYLSPRTVGAHLYRVFPKLGITSRAALRDALSGTAGRLPEPAAHSGMAGVL
jgi:DNA-binding CsgD family transcriptional regulator